MDDDGWWMGAIESVGKGVFAIRRVGLIMLGVVTDEKEEESKAV